MGSSGWRIRMDLNEIEKIIDAIKRNELGSGEAARRIRDSFYEDLGYAKVDHSRATRQGFPEVVFGQGKTRAQVVGIVERLLARSANVLVTHTDADTFGEIRNIATDAEWHETARLVRVIRDSTERGVGRI